MAVCDGKEVDVEVVLARSYPAPATHEAAAICGFATAKGFLRRFVPSRIVPIPGFERPMRFRKADILAVANGEFLRFERPGRPRRPGR